MSAEAFTKEAYDYVIIGGGTAGLVLAARLSEDSNVTVGVLEAGGNRLDDPMIDCPNNFMNLWDKPEYDWSYKTVPQEGLEGRSVYWPRGRCLGGSSAVNYNMFSMASRQDLDNWVALGNQGWGFDDLTPYYRKFETFNPTSKAIDAKLGNASKHLDPLLRGTDGPIQISWSEAETTWFQEVWPPTCLNAGHPQPTDPRSGSALGGFNQPLTMDPIKFKRSYSASAYYQPNSNRPNLSVLTNALVAKIELQKGGQATATGVSFKYGGTLHTVKARKEVIVCGGTVNSPQVLELSGIGSPSVLQKHGIDVVVDNSNVGESLCDHSASGMSFAAKDDNPTAEVLLRNPDIALQAFTAWSTHKAGPLANGPTTTGFLPFSLLAPDLPPSTHLSHISALLASAPPDPSGRTTLQAAQLLAPSEAAIQSVLLGVGGSTLAKPASLVFQHEAPGNWITLGACSTRTFSRGSCHIASSDPATHPDIDPAYMTNALDVEIAARGVLAMAKLVDVEPLASALKRDESGRAVVHPDHALPSTLEEAKEYVRGMTGTEYHPIGTCAMLPREKGGVVDGKLRVYGTGNVRVVDASVFPTHVQGNIVSLVYAIAEKAADIIKGAQK